MDESLFFYLPQMYMEVRVVRMQTFSMSFRSYIYDTSAWHLYTTYIIHLHAMALLRVLSTARKHTGSNVLLNNRRFSYLCDCLAHWLVLSGRLMGSWQPQDNVWVVNRLPSVIYDFYGIRGRWSCLVITACLSKGWWMWIIYIMYALICSFFILSIWWRNFRHHTLLLVLLIAGKVWGRQM